MINGWEESSYNGSHVSYVYDMDYIERIDLILNPSDRTLTLIGDAGKGVKLNSRGIEVLRKKLQQAERFLL